MPCLPRREEAAALELPDPSKATGSEEEQLAVYRQVRDDIARHIKEELLAVVIWLRKDTHL